MRAIEQASFLLTPARLFNRAEVLSRPSAAPRRPGVYGWYFDALIPFIDPARCHEAHGKRLLYVGISPQAPPLNGAKPSSQSLRSRLRTHYSGNAAGSTLRRTLGCLLAAELGIELRRVGSTGRYTFTNPGECALDGWMDRHAFVAWIEVERPWELEKQLISSDLRLPFNVNGNRRVELTSVISAARSEARQRADALPIFLDSGGSRKGRATALIHIEGQRDEYK